MVYVLRDETHKTEKGTMTGDILYVHFLHSGSKTTTD